MKIKGAENGEWRTGGRWADGGQGWCAWVLVERAVLSVLMVWLFVAIACVMMGELGFSP